MTDTQIQQLKRALLDEYGSFADRRIKNIDRGDRFIVDGRTDSDIASDGQVYGWFCSMFLEVRSVDHVTLHLTNVPTSDAVDGWLAAHSESVGRGHRVAIGRGSEEILAEFAAHVNAITAPGRRYSVPSYKYAVPRVVDALGRLARALRRGWQIE